VTTQSLKEITSLASSIETSYGTLAGQVSSTAHTGFITTPSPRYQASWTACRKGLLYALLVPVFPLLGYYLLDQTGISHFLMTRGIIPAGILGEGFGHVGLCFSIHYVGKSFQYFWKALSSLKPMW
jgi:hypothetical protein